MPILVCWAKTRVLNQISIHAITYQIHANTYLYLGPAYKYWHVSWYIVQVFGMYYLMMTGNSSKYINTYQYVQYIPFFLYIPILVNMFKYMQYIPYIPMLTNTGQYFQIHTNADIYRQIPTNTYNTYYYLLIQTSTYHTFQYIPYIQYYDADQYRSINTNTYKYILTHTHAYQYRSVLSNKYQYRHIQINAYQCV